MRKPLAHRMRRNSRFAVGLLLFGMTFISAGCHVAQQAPFTAETVAVDPTADLPRELYKAILPTYTIEPPDILLIDAIHVVPKSPYHLKTQDAVAISVEGTLPDAPISGVYRVEPGGIINLGFAYGAVKITGMTVEELQQALAQHLQKYLKEPRVTASLAGLGTTQQIAGEHLVGPDGTVTLGVYGSVPVVGLTIAGAKQAIEAHLAQHLEEPEVSVDVFAYNSKVFYVITQGAGMGDGVFRFPVTGNETVLDAIAQISGLEQVSSKRIWIARAGRDGGGCHQVIPVNWNAVTQCGDIETNYQILPGDRVYIAEDKLIAFDTKIGKLTAPLERIMGFTLLGTGTVTRLSGPVLRGGGNRGSNF